MLQSSKLLSVFKPDTLSGVLTLFNDHNLSYSRTGSEDNITLTRVHQLKYLGYLKLIGSGLQLMPLVAHPVRSLWGSQPRCARCVCEWLHRKWDGASLPYPGGKGGTSILVSIEVISCFGAREYTS